jgi:hypothetical protein
MQNVLEKIPLEETTLAYFGEEYEHSNWKNKM